jgi:2-polyprenyl-6-hydroxyphenyl methylase/3-demethylubiquinone-9 3-methyltransferase
LVDFNKVCSDADYYAFGIAGVPVYYRRCKACGFLFTDFFDAWNAEDFARWIYNADYALVDPDYRELRPAQFAQDVSKRLRGLESARILDYGSGAGVFSDRMRAYGFADTLDYDPFSSPTRPVGSFDLVTCFEVLEHASDPYATLLDIKSFLRPDGCILFSQSLQPDDILEIRCNWWYAAPRNGHMSLFSLDALTRLAQRAGLVACGRNGLYVFRHAAAGALTLRFFEEFGPALVSLRLHAPGQVEPSSHGEAGALQWHGLESSPLGAFRWSSRESITWAIDPVACLPCELLVTIPVLIQAFPTVLDGATLRAGAQTVHVAWRGNEARARLPITEPGVREITLTTQTPRSPALMRGESDQRPIGIAVSADVGAGVS